MDFLSVIYGFFLSALEGLRNIDWDDVKYPNKDLALGVLAFLIILVLLKIVFSRNRFSEKYSGYFISRSCGLGALLSSIRFLAKALIAIALTSLLVALAEPLLTITKREVVFHESRERVELLDVSASMSWEFEKSGKSIAEVARKGHLKFLEMRKGKNDRVSLWVFAQGAYQVEGFIRDDDAYEYRVIEAPYSYIDPGHQILPRNDPYNYRLDPILPMNRIDLVKDEGGTDLSYALRSVIRFVDEYGSREIRTRAILMITDAVVDTYPEAELKELKKRRIIPYVIYLKANEDGGRPEPNFFERLKNGEKLRTQISSYGGRYFDISNEYSLIETYKEIDRLEAVRFKAIHTVDRVLLFQNFILLGALFLVLALTLLLLSEFVGVYP